MILSHIPLIENFPMTLHELLLSYSRRRSRTPLWSHRADAGGASAAARRLNIVEVDVERLCLKFQPPKLGNTALRAFLILGTTKVLGGDR